MKILGIDPGYERLGIAVLEKNNSNRKEKILFSECFKTSKELEFTDRLTLIGKELRDVINKWKPNAFAIEILFMTTNQKTAMRVAEVRGVCLYEASLNDLKIIEITPLQIKMATTGYGKATKDQVVKMVKMLVSNKDEILKKTFDDEIDAIAVAITAFAHFKS